MINLNLGHLYDLMPNGLWSMSIQDQETKLYLDCRVISVSVTTEDAVPQYPVDSNGFRGDNIFRQPTQLQANIFVRPLQKSSFDADYKRANRAQGFIINTIGETYLNMRGTSLTRSESSKVVGGFFYDITFIEVIPVSAKVELLTPEKVKSLQDANKVAEGDKIVKQSTLKAGVNLL